MKVKKEDKQKKFYRDEFIQFLLVGLLITIIQLACSITSIRFPAISPTPTNTPSPTLTLSNSGKIAFGERESQHYFFGYLWIVNADGSNLEQLTTGPEGEIVWFEWSPDGKYILFLLGGKLWDLEVFNLESSNQVPNLDILNRMNLHNGLSLSPDVNKIAYRWNQDVHWDIWVMDIDGSNRINLTNSKYEYGSPIWSPDGSRIAYHSDRNCGWNYDNGDPYLEGTDRGNLIQVRNAKISVLTPVHICDAFWVMDADGSNKVQLTDFRISSEIWSSDSTKIAFFHDIEGGIWVVNADGSGLVQLTDSRQDRSPLWSPDGSKIAFNSIQSGNYDIWLMDADGSNQVQLTDDPAHETLGSWSPDGSRIVFSVKGNIWIINKDGSGLTQLTSGGGNFHSPVWQPGP